MATWQHGNAGSDLVGRHQHETHVIFFGFLRPYRSYRFQVCVRVHHGLSLILGYLKKLQPTQLDKSPVCTPLPNQESNQVSEDGGRLTQDVTGTLRPLSQKDTFNWQCQWGNLPLIVGNVVFSDKPILTKCWQTNM